MKILKHIRAFNFYFFWGIDINKWDMNEIGFRGHPHNAYKNSFNLL